MKRGRHDIEVRLFCIEHTEAIMMFGSNDDIFHARVLCHLYPFIGIELYRVKLLNKLIISIQWYLCIIANPFGIICFSIPFAGGYRIDTPMNKEAKPCIFPPIHAVVVL